MTNLKGIRNWLAALAGVVTFIVYLPSLQNGFVNWDDYDYIVENPILKHVDLSYVKWAFMPGSLNNYWQPVTLLSYAVDFLILGFNPSQYHLTNIIFHSLNTALVFMLAMRLYAARAHRQRKGGAPDARTLAAGFTAALLFGLHPLRVESVTWIAERKDVLYAFFFILSIIAYLKYLLPGQPRKALFYVLSLVCFILSVMSKPMAVTLPAALFIVDWFPVGRFSDAAGRVRAVKAAALDKLPFLAVSAASAALTLTTHTKGSVMLSFDFLPFGTRILVAVRGLAFYLYKFMAPTGLSPLYEYTADISILNPQYAASITAFFALSAVCVLTVKRYGFLMAAWLFYLVTLLPVSGILQIGRQAAADRFTYVPLLGISLAAGFALAFLADRAGKRHFIAVMAAVIVPAAGALAYLTVKQEAVWKDSVTLWTQAIEQYPKAGHGMVYYYRAFAYTERGAFREAARDYTEYINLSASKDPAAYINRGTVYMETGQLEAALKDFDTVIKLRPGYSKAYIGRGLVHLKAGRYVEAANDLQTGLKLEPDSPLAAYYLGSYYEKLGRKAEAAVYFKKAAALGLKASDVSSKQ